MQRSTRSAKKDPAPKKPAKSTEPRKPATRKKSVEPPAPVQVKRSSSVKSRTSSASKQPKVKTEKAAPRKSKDVIVDVKLEQPKQEPAQPKTEGLLEFEHYLQTQFAPTTEVKVEQVKTSAKDYKFTPAAKKGKSPARPPPAVVKDEEPQAVQSELLTMKMTKHINRDEAQKRAGMQVEEHDRRKVTIENSAFGLKAPPTGANPIAKREGEQVMNE